MSVKSVRKQISRVCSSKKRQDRVLKLLEFLTNNNESYLGNKMTSREQIVKILGLEYDGNNGNSVRYISADLKILVDFDFIKRLDPSYLIVYTVNFAGNIYE